MDELKFKVGDVVKHKAADLKMVIKYIYDEENKEYNCSWFNPETSTDDSGFNSYNFRESELELFNLNS